MSNISHFFGGTAGGLGPVTVTYDPLLQTGDTGAETDLGNTQGVTVRDNVIKADLVSDQDGSEAFNKVVTGHLVEIEMSLAKVSLEIIAAVMQGTYAYSAGAQGMGRVSAIGEDDDSISVPLELKVFEDGAATTDEDKMIIFPKVAPMTESEWTYDASTQRVTGAKFRAYASTSYTDSATGKSLLWFFRSSLTSGDVVFVT